MSMARSKHRAYELVEQTVEQEERWPEQLASEGPEGTHHRLSHPLSSSDEAAGELKMSRMRRSREIMRWIILHTQLPDECIMLVT
jgi:hypothetical protein